MSYDQIKTIALISGGTSVEREVSLRSGNHVYDALDHNKYHVKRYDSKIDLAKLVQDASEIDMALIILHGANGEDGTMQGLLDLLSIPYQGSGVLGSAVAMNKVLSKTLYRLNGIPIPDYKVVRKQEQIETDTIIKQIGLPLIIKPANGGSSVGITLAHSEDQLIPAIQNALNHDKVVLLESYIEGTELTCAVLGNDELEALPLIEIVPKEEHQFFNYDAKYTAGETQDICPARISADLTEKAQAYAKMAHQHLFCCGYSRTDMILKNDEIFVLETNTIPGMTPTSLFQIAAETAGISFSQLLDRLIDLSLGVEP
jgi:D-alanine-D-alanine ligase